VARLILRVAGPCANGPQGRGYKSYPNSTRSTCDGVATLPSLPANEINASLWRRNCQRRNDHWPGAWSTRTCFAKAVRAYRWQETFPLVRRILWDERTRGSIEDLFRSGLSLFSRKKFRRYRSRSIAR
jgi:hypothetical protein